MTVENGDQAAEAAKRRADALAALYNQGSQSDTGKDARKRQSLARATDPNVRRNR